MDADGLDSTPPAWIEIQAGQLRQTAYLVGEFWRALVDAGCPAHLADNLVQSWFDDTDALDVESHAAEEE